MAARAPYRALTGASAHVSGCKKCHVHFSTAPKGCKIIYCKCGACNHCHEGGICPEEDPRVDQYWFLNSNAPGERQPYNPTQSAGQWSKGWFDGCSVLDHYECKHDGKCYETSPDHWGKYGHYQQKGPVAKPVKPIAAAAVSSSNSGRVVMSNYAPIAPAVAVSSSDSRPVCRYTHNGGRCNRNNPDHWLDYAHPNQAPPNPAATVANDIAIALQKAKFCSNCGTKASCADKFCSVCGTKL